jgi:nucleotide-binding universal stress UspA family protein
MTLEMTMYKSILVPVDLAEAPLATPAINAAVTFAKSTGGKVRLIYVRSLMPVTYMEFVPADFDAEQQSDTEKKLASVAMMVDLPREQVSTKVVLGSVHTETLREAESWGADLVVVWSHKPGFASYLLGSNAATIVRHAKCSVLVVRDHLAKA